ncbi:MAG: phosphohydrolase [Tardiphaga sp.]|jgi:putative nucleotidyltransferase with HDIG domain|nr:phosphohydrolase [Tardiphaga sp.]
MTRTARPLTDALRALVRDELPEYLQIKDTDLRERVIEAWALSLAGSSFHSIREIQPAGNPNSMVLTRGDQTDHIRGVTRLAIVMADEIIVSNPDIAVKRDIVVAGGLCHDIGKPWEFDPENQKRWREQPRATGLPSLRHSVYGAHICLTAGLPEEVAHIAAAHSGEGELLVRSLENTIVHFADISYWSIMLAGGVIDPNTIAGKYKRPISM